MRVQDFLARLEDVGRQEHGWKARCPAHDDRHASLSVAEGDDGRVLVKCHAGEGCSVEEICSVVGVEVRDLYPEAPREGNGRRIVATYDYEDEHGALLFQVVRREGKQFVQRRPDGRGGWVWKGNSRRVLFRLPRVLEAVKAGETVYIAEGEKDVLALEAAGVVATCNPMGAGKWRETYTKALKGANVVVIRDRDKEGHAHADKIAKAVEGVAASVRIVEAVDGKDAADHLAAGKTITEFVDVLPENPEKPNPDADAASLSEKPVRSADLNPPGKPALADERDILADLRRDLRRAGLAGEQRGAQITYLALTSRVLPWGKPTNRPVSAIAKGTTSTGKSYTQRTVLRFFPPEAYFDLGSMSRRYLLYTKENLSHRVVVVPEWATIANDDEIVAALRTLLSEGRLVHGTVEGEGGGKREARRIEKDGPTGLLMTTTASKTDAELETRCLAFMTDDTPEQTRRVFQVLAELEDEDELAVDFERWRTLQLWIGEAGEHRVSIPYVRRLAELMPVGATRLRRDFVSMLCLVRAHAILHQATRERDGRGRIVATPADYAAVHELMDDLVAEGVDASVSAASRQTVQAVRELLDETGNEFVSVKMISDRLGVGSSATYDRVKRATAAGFLANLTKKDERGWKVALGADLPTGGTFLPLPHDVFRPDSDQPTGNENSLVVRDQAEFSAFPAFPVEAPEREVIGEEMYPVMLANSVKNGHLTNTEAERQYALHQIVEQARDRDGDDGWPL